MARKLVALFFPSLMPGGVQRVMLHLAAGFIKAGLRVDMVLVQARGHFLSRVPKGVRVVDLAGKRTLTSLPALVKYLRAEEPTCMLAAQTHCNLVAVWARMLSGVRLRLIISEHGMMTPASSSKEHVRERYLPALARLYYRKADGMLAVSSQTADDMARIVGMSRQQVTVIPNPVVPPDLKTLIRQRPKHPWFRSRQVPFLLSVGRLSAEKDFPTLLRALAMLRSRRPLRLLILGEGEKRSELESLTASLGINEDVSLPGFEVNPFQYMARCAAFVLSSTWEGFGNVLVEALACGAQIVSTDCPGGPREILAGGKYGLLVHPGDPTSMAAAVDYLLEHPLSENRLRERAKDFTIEAILPQYLRLLFPEGLA